MRLSVVTEPEPNDVPDDKPGVVVKDAPSVMTAATPWYRRRGILAGLALVVAAVIAAMIFNTGRADHSTSSAVEVVPAKPPGQNETILRYIKDNQITSTAVQVGDPGAPKIVIALPQGWSDLGTDTPPRAYGAVQSDTAGDPNDPPTIVVLLSKLTGDVDPAKILEYAPGELRNLPNYVAAAEPTTDKLSGFDAIQLAGLYERDGTQRTIAQKTVVIPANDAVYVLQMNADALKSDAATLMQATEVIDKQTKITP
ncbi:MAG: LpqN/LpqT family lipoprotein [Actinomycetes bacterium]